MKILNKVLPTSQFKVPCKMAILILMLVSGAGNVQAQQVFHTKTGKVCAFGNSENQAMKPIELTLEGMYNKRALVVSGQSARNLPAGFIEKLVLMRPGLANPGRGNEIVAAGARPGNTIYIIDGMVLNNSIGNSRAQQRSFPK